MRLTQWLEELWQDVIFAVRQLKSAPGFAATAAITLALGIGGNSAIFALVDAALLRPLPFPDPDRLVMIWERHATSARGGVAPPNLLDWNERNRTFESMAGFTPGVGGMVMAGADGTAETVPRQWVTAGIFEVLGVKPIAGRTMVATDDAQRANVVVLSEAFWRTRFNADPSVVGREIRLDGDLFTIIGVVPGEAQVIGRSSIWAMIQIQGAPPEARGAHFLRAIGRTQPGVTLEMAERDLAQIAEALERDFPDTNKGRGVTLERLDAAVVGTELRFTSMLFLGVVGFVLLICCANVANLLMTRATVRARELAIRSALGAGRGRVTRQLLTESLVLAMLGGVLGVGVGAAILAVVPAMIPEGLLPVAVTLAFDMRIMAFCLAAALLVGLLFGMAPAWQATDLSSSQVITSSRGVTGRGGKLRSLLVAGEVATSVALLFGAGLLLRTLVSLDQVDRGYRADDVLTMMVDPLGSSYPTPESLEQFFRAIDDEVLAVPGVRSVAWASTLPLGESDAGSTDFEIVGEPPPDPSRRPSADFQIVSPGYFEALDLPVVAGRAFDDRDARDGVPVCIVNEAFVRRHLQGRSAVGTRITLSSNAVQGKPVVREVVGVARQVKGRPDEAEDFVQVYIPLAQGLRDDMYLLVRPASGSADGLARSVRAAIGRVDREQLVSVRSVMTLDDVASSATARHRFRAVLVMAFAGLALLLAMVGVFGILAYAVQQRVRDIGVRRALGATTGDVIGLVLRGVGGVIAAGAVVGLVLSAVLGRFITSLLHGVEPLDPLTFASVTILLALAAGIAAIGPAWRASQIDPAVALRTD
jgi:putative ABC transport system permease protein